MPYEGIRFEYSSLVHDVRRIKSFAESFLASDANQVLAQLESNLQSAQYAGANKTFQLRISKEWPLQTRPSTSYSRDRNESVYGLLDFCWDIRNPDQGVKKQRYFDLIGIASTRIRFHRCDGGNFDLVAQWQIEAGDADSPGCHFHTAMNQYGRDGLFPEWLKVPRLPSILLWPMDALDFLLGELFQGDWEKHLSVKNDERISWGKGQEIRLARLLNWQSQRIGDWNTTPWMALKRAKPRRDFLIEN